MYMVLLVALVFPCAQAAWRMLRGALHGAEREWGRLVRPEGADPSADASAVFPDGMKWAVPAVSCGEADMQQRARASPALWEGEHRDGGKVAVRQYDSKDRAAVILWHSTDARKKPWQKCQLLTHSISEQAKDP